MVGRRVLENKKKYYIPLGTGERAVPGSTKCLSKERIIGEEEGTCDGSGGASV